MGYSKVVNKGNGKVVIVHQLDQDGKPYAEDVTVEVQAGVDPHRVAGLASLDGKIGYLSYQFSPASPQPENIKFPEA
jgi:hypothetical protein